jgi:branched-chain amino acid transport system permease protein
MTQLFELTINGLSLGAIYALIAIGFVLIFKATGIVNFAHGSILLLGAYVAARVQGDLGFWLSVLVGAAVAATGAVIIELVIMRRVRGVEAGVLAIITLGVDVVRVGGAAIPEARLAAAVVAVIVIGAFLTAFSRTDWGVAMRAAAADGKTASLMGVRLNRVAMSAWALAGALAALAGVFFVSFPSPGVDNATGLQALAAIPAAVIGGLDSIAGALVGGIIVGLVATYCAGYQDELSFLGRGLGEVAPYAVMFLVLLVRPSGLFGTQAVNRV